MVVICSWVHLVGARRETSCPQLKVRFIEIFCAALLWCFLFFWGSTVASAQINVQTYDVKTGDTLGLIAERFGVTLEQLVEFNNISDPNLIAVGQVLRIPNPHSIDGLDSLPQAVLRAQPGETLSLFSRRLGLDLPLIAALNNLSDTSRLFPAQPILVPLKDAPPSPLLLGAINEVQLPTQLIQGETGRIVVTSRRPLSLTASWNGLPLIFSPVPSPEITSRETSLETTGGSQVSSGTGLSRHFALIPVPALLAPQPYSVVLSYTTQSDYVVNRSWLVDVAEGPYTSAEIVLPPETSQLLAPVMVQDELNRLWEVWGQHQTPLQWSGFFTRPLESQYVTSSPFGTRRSYNGGPYNSYHSGQDFGAPIGAIVRAPAPGTVALAEPLNVRGNAILIDHGRGIYTGYWHLNEIQVIVGQSVERGDIIGLVGTTGLSTGAHLHWELRIYGIGVNPMQFLDEPLINVTDVRS